MATESIPVGSSTALNLELLIDRRNYKTWRLRVKTYLLSEDLWDVIEAIGEPPKLEDDQAGYKAWTKKNARALHAIQSSCGPKMLPVISETESAKTAWEALEQECKVQGFDVNNINHYITFKLFIEHVISGTWEEAKKCLGEVDVRSVAVVAIAEWGYKDTALHIAARIGHAHIVKDIVRLNGLMKPEDYKTKTSGKTALHLAAAQGHVHVVRELPVKLIGEVKDNVGDTALHNAVNAGKVDVVKELVNWMRQEDLQIKNHEGYTALHLAVNKGDMRVVKLLVRKTEGENKEDFKRYIPFTDYVRNGDWDKANECLGDLDDPCRRRAIVAVDPRDRHGRTALHVAAWEGHLDVIKGLLSTLLKMRDHLELKTAEDFTTFGSRIALGVPVSEELLMKKAEYMVEQYESTPEGALEIQDSDGFTPLHIAVDQKHMDMVKEIAHMMRQEGLEIRCNRFCWRFPFKSALHLAVLNGNIDIVKELVPLMRKEGFEIKDHDENTALHNAVSQGNVDMLKELVKSMRPEGFNVKNNQGFNALHLAVTKRYLHIVKELMPLMEPWDLKEKDHQDFSALGYAIAFLTDKEAREIARDIAKKDAALFGITSGPEDDIPVVQALRLNKWELACYLYKLTPLEFLDGRVGSEFLCYCFDRKQFYMAWDLLHHYPSLAMIVHSKDKTSPMLKLSRMSYAFLSGSQLTSYQKWIYNCIPIGKVSQVNIHDDISIDVAPSQDDHQNKRDLIFSVIHFFRRFVEGLNKLCGIHKLYEMKQTHIKIFEILRCIAEATKHDNYLGRDEIDTIKTSMFKAIQRGHFEFVTRICEGNPNLLGKLLEDKRVKGIFHYAIESRQKEVYSLIYQIGEKERHELGISLVNGDYTLLHYAANLSSLSEFDHIQDACLQMQRELQWFKEVEKVVPSEMYEHRDRANDMTARELFTKNHKKLLEEAQIYIKGTATSCAGVVGALFVTIMFAAAFTVPGGNDDQTGFPQFLDHKLFKVYIVSDIISLVSATSSVIIFLGILTSRYAENDFIKSLPTKIMFSLITLFFAIISMVIVFSCALILMFGGEAWVVKLSILLTSVPVFLFIRLLFPLLIKTYMSTYGQAGNFGTIMLE